MIINGIELKYGMTVEIDEYNLVIICDEKGNEIFWETLNNVWIKREFDDEGNIIYSESSDGYVLDKRPKNILRRK